MRTLHNTERLQCPLGFRVGQRPRAETDQAHDERQKKSDNIKSGLMTEWFHWLFISDVIARALARSNLQFNSRLPRRRFAAPRNDIQVRSILLDFVDCHIALMKDLHEMSAELILLYRIRGTLEVADIDVLNVVLIDDRKRSLPVGRAV